MTGRRVSCSRGNSMNPVFLPMVHLLFSRDRNRRYRAGNVLLLRTAYAEHAFELMREHFDEAWEHFHPVVENTFCTAAARQFVMTGDQIVQLFDVARLDDRAQVH